MRVAAKGALSWLVTLILIGVVFSSQSIAEGGDNQSNDTTSCNCCSSDCPGCIFIFMEQKGNVWLLEDNQQYQVVYDIPVNFTVLYVWGPGNSEDTGKLEKTLEEKKTKDDVENWIQNKVKQQLKQPSTAGDSPTCSSNCKWDVYINETGGRDIDLKNKPYLIWIIIDGFKVGIATSYKITIGPITIGGNLKQYTPLCEASEFNITAKWWCCEGCSKITCKKIKTVSVSIVPEPLTIFMATIGVLSVLGFTYKRRESKF